MGEMRWIRRSLFFTAFVLIVGLPVFMLLRTWATDSHELVVDVPGTSDDSSGLERGQVLARLPADSPETVQAALLEAKRRGCKVSIAGARHSQGGHTLTDGGLQLDMTAMADMRLDSDALVVGAGAIWRDVIRFLDTRGRSVAIMQSDADFSVGGTISVNAHGWQPHRPPIGSSVRRLRVVTADGRDRWISRRSEGELFRHVVGGYGLFGVILSAELQTVANQRYRVDARLVKTSDLFRVFPDANNPPDVGLEYARLDPRHASRFEEALHVRYWLAPSPGPIEPAEAPGMISARRVVFRASVGSRYGKRLRWNLERAAALKADGDFTTRNSVLLDTSDVVLGRSASETDILHEYFVPPQRAAGFLAAVRRVVDAHDADLLNVTVRDVRTDRTSALRWATEDVVAFLMFFHQRKTAKAEERMEVMTRELIDLALNAGGRFYLPYRRHATHEQLLRAYPMWPAFVQRKRAWDPEGRFDSRFFTQYAR